MCGRRPATGKVRHRNKKAAYAARDFFKDWSANVYWCSVCRNYHLGHPRWARANVITNLLNAHAERLDRRNEANPQRSENP